MGPLLASSKVKECVPVDGTGRIQLDDSGEQMALFLETRLGVVDDIGTDKCIDKLSRPGLEKQCYTVGLFKRDKASPAMREAMQQLQWKTVRAPEAGDWRVGKMQPSGGKAELSDWLLNGGGTDLRNEVVAGTRMLMARFACDSTEIKQLEKNLLRFQNW